MTHCPARVAVVVFAGCLAAGQAHAQIPTAEQVPRRTVSVAPVYPPEALPSGAHGVVRLEVTIDESGGIVSVTEAGMSLAVTGQSTPDESRFQAEAFQRAAVDAVRRWRYEPPPGGPVTVGAVFRFAPEADTQLVAHGIETQAAFERARRLMETGSTEPLPPPSMEPDGTLRVGNGVLPPAKTRHVNPEYPADARAAGIEGTVVLEVQVEADGRVGDVRVLRSVPELDQEAGDAVRQWEFTQTLFEGIPVPVVMTATVQFTLD